MFTIKDDTGHSHKVNIDGNGNGETISTDKGPPHTHQIEDYCVLEKLDHIHEIDQDVKKTESVYKEGDPPKVTMEERSPSLSEKIQNNINITVSINDDKSDRSADSAGGDRLPRGESDAEGSTDHSSKTKDTGTTERK